MRYLSVRRGSRPAVIGGGLVAISVAVASCVAALSGGPGTASGTPSAGERGPGHHARGAGARGTAGTAGLTGSGYAAVLSLPGASGALSGAGGALSGAPRLVPAGPTAGQPGAGPSAGSGTAKGTSTAGAAPAAGSAVPRLIVPDIIAAAPGGVTAADLARLRKLSLVRAVLPIDGARITVNGRPLTVLGAPAGALRPWTPPATAASPRVWSDFAAGDLITTASAARSHRLASGGEYPAAAATATTVRFGTQALLGIAGVDAIVNETRARQFGLVRDVAVLINAPAADMTALAAQVAAALGAGSQAIRLVPVAVSTSLPVDTSPPKGRPANYLALFKESAALYCPGLSWTVLAAIGQIESGDGANMGPSSAGALGPMQFLPSTWRSWGIDGFGDTGPPNVMNPFDAVPSAARLLCADGAAAGGQQLRRAIFGYNHATWYVDEVLTLAAEYAREFG